MHQLPPLKPTSEMVISHAVHFAPGKYQFLGSQPGITITGSHLRLNLQGVLLQGAKGKVGIHLKDCTDVVLTNASVSGFTTGVELTGCKNVVLENCRSLHSADPGPGTIIDESGAEPQDTSGAGFLVRDSSNVKLGRCSAMYAWDGLDLVNSDHCSAQDCNFSYNENWGVHIWRSNFNIINHCTAIWCTTGRGKLYQALTGWQTYDADAVLIEHGSDNNTISDNDLRYGGDGIFIRSNEAPVTPGTAVPHVFSSDNNRLIGNDCSYSPNNAIEVDFVKGTLIERNNCSLSNYGMWLGYSRYSKVVENLCAWDTVRAIEIENGQHGTISRNIFADPTPPSNKVLVFLRQNGRDATPSGPYLLGGNLFVGGSTALALLKTPVTMINNLRASNSFKDEPPALLRSDGLSQVTVQGDTVKPGQHQGAPVKASITNDAFVTLTDNQPANGLPIAMAVWQNRPFLAVRHRDGSLRFTVEPQPTLNPWKSRSELTVYLDNRWTAPQELSWRAVPQQSLISAVVPTALTAGAEFQLKGRFTTAGRVMVNGIVVGRVEAACTSIACKLPATAPKGFANLLFQPDNGIPAGPIVVTVAAP